jgi:pimeloyl-ACP methyl ester carboxylesterase
VDLDLAPPLILAGFSAGSAIAGHLILSGELEVEGLISIAPWTRRDFDELVEASLVMPTLVICGADDSLISVELLGSKVGGGGQIELQVVDGLGHEHPMDLAQRVAGFLEGL